MLSGEDEEVGKKLVQDVVHWSKQHTALMDKAKELRDELEENGKQRLDVSIKLEKAMAELKTFHLDT